MKIERGSRRSWGRRIAAAVLLAGIGLASSAHADTIVGDLGVAGPGNFAILGLNSGVTITLNGPGQTFGNVGGFGDVAMNSSSPPAILGNLFLGTAGNTGGSAGNLAAQVSGSIIKTAASNTFLTNAASAAINAANTFGALTPDQTISTNITSTTTLTATHSGFYVVNVNADISLGNNDKLILTQAAGVNAQFVLNVNGNITLNGGNNFSGGEIVLSGGLTQNNVVVNVTSTANDNVTSSGGSSPDPAHSGNTLPNAYIQGILLDVNGGIHLSPGQVYGEIIGGGKEINLVSGSQVTSNSVTTPLPTTAFSGIALLGVVGAGMAWRKRRAMA